MKMEKANAKMKEVGITLKTPFDFNEFLNTPKYAEAIIAVYDVLKHNYNIFDIISKAPHFSQMLKSYNNVLTAYATVDKQLDFTMNVASKLYDKSAISASSVGKELYV
jgi:hypothetical protein